ncbi:MAG: hypothetical protein KKE62_02625 [Proteobacteria bacterium]|nr:hypothetical protein [Pseudomonadota bacterium]MBU1387433.1 hypothetical protein [Pseudomonadota bacterium]MBU1541718.1 hypothetical protein [Pseudomonadota bacterium]MBU2479664.1 hypothetical protein [Pseudomonadota bacterium]
MKIISSDMVFLSDHQFDQMDASLNEKMSKTLSSQNRRAVSWADPPGIIVDRVSISQNRTVEYQSNYSASVSSRSSVFSLASGETVSHEQQSAMEKLIGGVIEKDVVIRSIQAGEDVVLGNGDPIPSSVQGSVPQVSGRAINSTWEISLKQTDIHFEEEHLSMSSSGQVTTEDGRKIDFSLDLSLNRSFVSRTREETLVQRWQERVNLTDPLVISFDGKAPTLSDAQFEFDLDSDGETQMIHFVNPGSGFLAFDKNNDQIINDGSELFGPGTGNGFGELAQFDEDQNHWIDENDAVFSQLSVWTRDENGKDMLISLKDAGVGAISLDHAQTLFNMTSSDNSLQGQLKNSGVFLFEDGKAGSVSQVDLASRPVQAEQPIDPPFAHPLRIKEELSVNLQPGAAAAVVEEESTSPLKELLDRIKEIKEQMGRLYESMKLTTPDNRRRRSGMNRYQPLNIESSILTSGYQSGPIRFYRLT